MFLKGKNQINGYIDTLIDGELGFASELYRSDHEVRPVAHNFDSTRRKIRRDVKRLGFIQKVVNVYKKAVVNKNWLPSYVGCDGGKYEPLYKKRMTKIIKAIKDTDGTKNAPEILTDHQKAKRSIVNFLTALNKDFKKSLKFIEPLCTNVSVISRRHKHIDRDSLVNILTDEVRNLIGDERFRSFGDRFGGDSAYTLKRDHERILDLLRSVARFVRVKINFKSFYIIFER